MKLTKAHGKDSQVRSDCKSKVPTKIPGHQTKDKQPRAAVASKERGADSGKEVQLVQEGLTMKRYHADGEGEFKGRHIRKNLHDNESIKMTKIAWTVAYFHVDWYFLLHRKLRSKNYIAIMCGIASLPCNQIISFVQHYIFFIYLELL